MYAYRSLRVKIPWRLLEERPDILDLVSRMQLAVEDYVRLLKERADREKPKVAVKGLDGLLSADNRERAVEIVKEVFARYGLKKYLVDRAKFFWREMIIFKAVPLDAQLRTIDERDRSNVVFVDLKNGIVRVRKLGIPPFEIPLKKSNVAWVRRRLEEKAQLKLSFLGIEKRVDKGGPTYGGLYIALVFAREIKPVDARALVAVDVNRLDHGVVAGVIRDGKLVSVLRLPDGNTIEKLRRLHEEISQLESSATVETDPTRRKRLEDRTSYLKSKRFRKIRGAVTQIAEKITSLARENSAAIVVDNIEEKSYQALKEGSGDGERKLYLDGLGQLRRRLQALAQWYGLPYLEERLYSTVCPKCGARMLEERSRLMRCPTCGFSDHRDRIPLLWAKKRYVELLEKARLASPPPPSIETQLLAPQQ